MARKVFEANSAMVFYAWDKPETLVLAEGHELSVQEQRAVLRSHVNLGHPGRAEFVRLLKAAGCRNDIIQYVQREFRCAGCDLEQRPPTRLPAATPRCYDFNVVIGIDVLFIHGLDNKTEHPVLNVTCLGTLYSTFGLIDPLRRSAKLTLKAFERLWVRTFGPPDFLLYDMGTEFTGSDFQTGIERMCIQPIVCDQEAPWENGVCERRGDLFKKVYYKSREIAQPRDMDEVELLVFESAWAPQTSINRSGFTPAQRVLGRQPRVALDLASDDKHYELSVTQDKAWTRAAELRDAARKALMELDAKNSFQRASRARPRRQLETKVFSEGQPVVVWRQGRRGALSKVGPCYVILQRGSTVWVSRRGELWKCNASQVFEMGPLEVQGLEVIPRDLLMAKERLKFDSEKLGFVDVSQENVDEGDLERSPLDGPKEPPAVRVPPQGDRAVPSESPPPPPGGAEMDELPSDLEDYSPDTVQLQSPQDDGAVPSESLPPPGGPLVHEPLAHAERATVTRTTERAPLQYREPQGQAAPPELRAGHEPSTSSTAPTPVVPLEARGQWPQAVVTKKWTRYDNNADRFRVSSSKGPMWSDVIRRRTVDLDAGKVVADEEFTGDERPRELSRVLPTGVKNIETTLFYRPRPGHPDPGVTVSEPTHRGDGVGEDRRLFDRGLKRGHDGSGHPGAPQPKSKIGGIWVADCVTPWGDKRKFPVIANARDLQAFGKLVKADVFYTYSELHSGWICLTKKSGKEIQERTLTEQERKMFDEAKITEIENLEGSSAISFVTDPEEVRKIKESLSHRIMPSRFILTKKQQELGQSWKAKARWILLGHRDPDAQELERYAPTPATPTVYLAFQILSSLHYELVIMDVSSAFGQSDHHEREQGPLFATMPPSGIPGKGKDEIIRVLTAVYGLVNAPAMWRRTVRRVLKKLGYLESTFDPCLYVLPFTAEEDQAGRRDVQEGQHGRRGCAGLVLLDVDDFLQGGNPRHRGLMERLRGRFRFGRWRTIYKGSGEYLGRTVYQLDNYEIQVSMERYINEKLRPVVLPRDKIKDEDRVLDERETTLLRGAGGSLLWLGRESRPDVAAACALAMAWGKEGPKVRQLKLINKTIQELKRTSDVRLRVLPIPLERGIWMVFSDASVGNLEGDKSQGGFIVAFADRDIIEGKVSDLSINSWKSAPPRCEVLPGL